MQNQSTAYYNPFNQLPTHTSLAQEAWNATLELAISYICSLTINLRLKPLKLKNLKLKNLKT